MIVNDEFVRRYLSSAPAVGRRFPALYLNENVVTEIVGVVGTVLKDGNDRQPQPEIYFVQGSPTRRIVGAVNLVMRTAGDPAVFTPAIRKAAGDIDREQMYTPVEAVRLLKEQPAAKFDETIEVHLNLGLNVRHAEEQLRGTMMLPHGTGREQRVAVFAEGDKAREAEEAGADIVGSADLAKKIEEGFTDFDVAIATPDQMGNVGRLGRVLGPRGLMPNPKTGTVTFDVAKAVKDAKAGKLEYRTDRGANVHIPIGKKSFEERALVENYAALIDEIVRAKPSAAKGRYIKKITLSSTMGPGIHVDPTRTRDIAEELADASSSSEVAATA